MLEFTPQEQRLFKRLRTPAMVQSFLNSIPMNHELDGIDTIKSPVRVLRTQNAHCIEAAILGAYILSLHRYPPLLIHLAATDDDFDHVIALFKQNGYWGALSKTNHAILRYREPVYKTIRELALSYFHEYFTNDGTKTLRAYSAPLDLRTFEDGWETEDADLWGIDEALDKIRHFPIAPPKNLQNLRLADKIERAAGKIVEWKKLRGTLKHMAKGNDSHRKEKKKPKKTAK